MEWGRRFASSGASVRRGRLRTTALAAGLALATTAATAWAVADPPADAASGVRPGATVASVPHRTLQPGPLAEASVRTAPPGTVFLLTPGVYDGFSVVPKDRQQFLGQPGAVLDGGHRVAHAFSGPAVGVRISNLVLRNYTNPAQDGTIDGSRSQGWEVDHNEITEAAGAGLKAGPGMHVHDNWLHHNHQLGMTGSGADIVVDHNDISFNNYTHDYDPGWEAGGTKFIATTNLEVTNNDVHDNYGPGLWTDIHNEATTYAGNYVHDNNSDGAAAGIFHEISGSAVIRDNVVVRNGTTWHEWGWNGGIQVAVSSDVEIFGNTVLDNGNGITLIHQNRYDDWAPGLRNINVHDNTIRTAGLSGAFVDTGENIVGTRNIVFAKNRFVAPAQFSWQGETGPVPAWAGSIVSSPE